MVLTKTRHGTAETEYGNGRRDQRLLYICAIEWACHNYDSEPTQTHSPRRASSWSSPSPAVTLGCLQPTVVLRSQPLSAKREGLVASLY